MTWSAFALFLARRTEFAFNIGHFFLSFCHFIAYWPLFKFLFLWHLIFLKSLFWMKQIQGSVKVKIKEYVHAPSELLFVLLLAIFNFFPRMNYFYYFTSVHGLQDVKNHCTHLRDIELKSGRKIPYLPFPMYYSLYNWIGEHEITKPKKKFCFESRKKDTKTSTKRHEWNRMTQNGLFDIFSNAQA